MGIRFVKSASSLEGCPKSDLPEVAFIGRSNAGKSSILNKMMGQRVARVSQTPGKTDLLNFYNVNQEYHLVDLPGYGYASRSKADRAIWKGFIESYLAHRPNLKGVVLLVDIARPWTSDEEALVEWLRDHNRQVLIVLNKIDKLNQKELAAAKKRVHEEGLADALLVSARTGAGLVELQRTVFENLICS